MRMMHAADGVKTKTFSAPITDEADSNGVVLSSNKYDFFMSYIANRRRREARIFNLAVGLYAIEYSHSKQFNSELLDRRNY